MYKYNIVKDILFKTLDDETVFCNINDNELIKIKGKLNQIFRDNIFVHLFKNNMIDKNIKLDEDEKLVLNFLIKKKIIEQI